MKTVLCKLNMARVLVAFLPFWVCFAGSAVAADKTDNALTDLKVSEAQGQSVVTISAKSAFGENYSTYVAQSPKRIVIDLPRMDVTQVPSIVDGVADGVVW